MNFSRYLSDFGLEPVVITVDPLKGSYKFLDESLLEKVRHVRVFRTNSFEPLHLYIRLLGGDKQKHIPQGFAGESDPTFFQKMSRFLRGNLFLPDARKGWNRYAFNKGVELIEKEDISLVITSGPPHSTHLIGENLKSKFGIKWMADFRDPWSEVYYNKMLYRTDLAKRVDARMEKRILRNADSIVTIGPGMKSILQGKVPGQEEKFHFIYNGYDGEMFDSLRKDENKSGNFIICHAGILSHNQPIDAFLSAMRIFLERKPEMKDRITMRFVGKVSPGIIKDAKNVFSHVDEIGYVNHAVAVKYIKEADLLLNSFAISDQTEVLVSGKLMEYLATGNPVLCLGDTKSDAAMLMKDMEHARIFERSDVTGISEFIEKVYIYWLEKKEFTVSSMQKYSRYETTRQLSELIKSLL